MPREKVGLGTLFRFRDDPEGANPSVIHRVVSELGFHGGGYNPEKNIVYPPGTHLFVEVSSVIGQITPEQMIDGLVNWATEGADPEKLDQNKLAILRANSTARVEEYFLEPPIEVEIGG